MIISLICTYTLTTYLYARRVCTSWNIVMIITSVKWFYIAHLPFVFGKDKACTLARPLLLCLRSAPPHQQQQQQHKHLVYYTIAILNKYLGYGACAYNIVYSLMMLTLAGWHGIYSTHDSHPGPYRYHIYLPNASAPRASNRCWRVSAGDISLFAFNSTAPAHTTIEMQTMNWITRYARANKFLYWDTSARK